MTTTCRPRSGVMTPSEIQATWLSLMRDKASALRSRRQAARMLEQSRRGAGLFVELSPSDVATLDALTKARRVLH